MLDVCLLGTGGMMPLPYRWLTSLMVRYNGSSLLIDCGEGTQIAIKEKGWSFKPIDVICFTHYHGDHISGLPGLLLTMGNADRTEPLTLVGPKGLERVVNALRVIAPELPFPIKYIEIKDQEQTLEMNGYRLKAFRVNHNVTCYGYTMEIDRAGKFDVERANANAIPKQFWGILQKGETIEDGEHVYTPDMVLGPARKGLKLTYCTDTRPVDAIRKNAMHSDLFICEGMYGEKDKQMKELLLDSSDTIVADGVGIIKAAKMLKYPMPAKIPGVDIAKKLFEYGNELGKTIFLFGAKPEIVEQLNQVLRDEYKDLKVVGTENGYVQNKDAVFEKMKQLQPDIVLVALGMPQQEKLIYKHLKDFEKGIFVGVGGSFDVLSGMKQRAPHFFVKHNIEWLYRITKEPYRLKRFYNSNIKFIFRVMFDKNLR